MQNRARAMTLIEVVAALALLGAILTGVVLAKARLARQWYVAEYRLRAVEAVDDLVVGWMIADAGVPIDAHGELTDGLVWRTRVNPERQAEALGARVIRLEVRREVATQEEALGATPLLTLDLLAPELRPSPQRSSEATVAPGISRNATQTPRPGSGP